MPRYDFRSPRLYLTDELAAGAAITLSAQQSHYLVSVMRLRPGGQILVFNGRDGEWTAEISAANKRSAAIVVKERVREQTEPCDLHYLFAPLKRARLDYLVQKATEMGASLLQPVVTERTVSERVKMERIEANIVEAAEQCGILTVPVARAPIKLSGLLADWDARRRIVLCDEDAPVKDPLAALREVAPGPLAVLVGPEGGFTEAERAMLRAKSYVTVISLGPRILRADTAAVAALALVQAVLGDFS